MVALKFRYLLLFMLTLPALSGFAQQGDPTSPQQDGPPGSSVQPPAPEATPLLNRQPNRILGIIPNYRAVSPGAIPPPPAPRQAFKIASQNSFDYSALLFAGFTSLIAEGTNTHRQLGKGINGFGRYYWRGFANRTAGNYLVLFALPTVFHEDERYYAKGGGNFWKRGLYAASRVLVTPDYHGNNTFNASEVFGRGIAQAISASYYPGQERTVGGVAVRYGRAVGRDALTNVFREFWPDIATHVLHRHP